MMEAQTKQENHGSLRFYGKHAKINKQIQIQIFEFFITFVTNLSKLDQSWDLKKGKTDKIKCS